MKTPQLYFCVAASVCAFALCWFGKLDGGNWVAAQALILGVYHAHDVLQGRVP